MKNQLNLNIQTPCSENFNQFKPTEKGGFCNSCDKEVIDFTKMNSEEIITYFKAKSEKNTCGRFNSNQLNSNLIQPKKFSFFGRIGLACLTLFSFGTLQAQDTKPTTESDSSKQIIKKDKNDILIKGNVSESGLPLAGVNIILEGTSIGVQTDFDGNFEFPKRLKKGDVLIFSFVGMATQKLIINNEHSASKIQLQVNMNMPEIILMGKVASKKVYSSKKNK